MRRLRIGHSTLTHPYLMTRDYPPYCEGCIIPLTIKRTIEECPEYAIERHILGQNPSFFDIFENQADRNGVFYCFLWDIDLLYHL